MRDRISHRAFLRNLNFDGSKNSKNIVELSDHPMILGRDPSCDIVIDMHHYGSVSRRHAEISPIYPTLGNQAKTYHWQICDLQSANGTFINGIHLSGCQELHQGDRIELTKGGPQFIFELVDPSTSNIDNSWTEVVSASPSITDITFTQLLPIFSSKVKLWQHSYLWPGIATVIFVVMMFACLGQPKLFNLTISTYISLTAYYFIYRLCRKQKPWWMILATAIFTAAILRSPILSLFIWFFYHVLPGSAPSGAVNLLSLLVSMFFGAGLMEELLKALPIFGWGWIGGRCDRHWKSQLGINEPLDGIIIGTASAIGFTLTETLGLYVPNIIQNITTTQAGAIGMAELTGLQLLIPRVLGSVAGHMAYSGYFGYFIGLSMLKPKQRWRILAIGYISAAFLHALWNTSALISFWLLAIVGIVSYAFLIASIGKAHNISQKFNL
ncbi:MAG: PrsW family glutamic-type intramembrane protease [Pseudanabaenaceae cyanobacterium bins.39]|nr:PrsW family glutamic-type intramembrane protease [Pseudanabaenaceae cyanobacterium bins.39]